MKYKLKKMNYMKYLYFLLTFFCINSVVAESQGYEHIRVSTDIELIRINGNFYVHTTWYNFPEFGRFPSNGLIFIKNGKALLIDTPNTYEQTLRLDNYLKDNLNAVTTKIIVGHSHTDCMGGLSVLHEKGVESVACSKTISICKSKKLPIPQKSFSDSMTFEFEGEKVICKYFGAGHTVDNIVVYFPDPQILFGGCLIKCLNSVGLGNTKEADIDNWDRAVTKIGETYPEIKFLIPGHGAFGNFNLLNHTIDLVKKYKQSIQ